MLTDRELEILKRRAAGESQSIVAKALGISQAAISKTEKNSERKILEAERHLGLLKSFGISIDDSISGRRVIYAPKKRKGGAR